MNNKTQKIIKNCIHYLNKKISTILIDTTTCSKPISALIYSKKKQIKV